MFKLIFIITNVAYFFFYSQQFTVAHRKKNRGCCSTLSTPCSRAPDGQTMFCCYLHVLPVALSNNCSFSKIKKHIPVQSCKWSRQAVSKQRASDEHSALYSYLKIFSIHTKSQRQLLSCYDQNNENHKMFVQFDRMSYLPVNLWTCVPLSSQ